MAYPIPQAGEPGGEDLYQHVKLEGMVLKPNMVVPGMKSAKHASVAEVAEKTVRVLKACVPAAVQKERDAPRCG